MGVEAWRRNRPLVEPMNSLPFNWIVVFCAGSFTIYAVSCLTSAHMKREFLRYGLAKYRVPTGALQLLGVVGLLVGLKLPAIGSLAAAGFTAQMLLALWVRRRIHDSLLQCVPAFVYMALNAWLCAQYSATISGIAHAGIGSE